MLGTAEGLDMVAQIFSQDRKLVRFLFSLYFLPLLFLFAVVVASTQMGVSLAMFTRDPASVAQIHPFIGVVSNFGVMLWIFRHSLNETRFATFLLCSGLLTILLLLDDFFLLHEFIFPHYFGVSEKIVFLGYGGLMICWMVTFRKCILKTEYLILLIALGFFGLSLFIDVFQHRIQSFIGNSRILFEDGFKLLGIVGWLGYFLRCCLLQLGNKMGADLKC
jgi:hypothetical protein